MLLGGAKGTISSDISARIVGYYIPAIINQSANPIDLFGLSHGLSAVKLLVRLRGPAAIPSAL